MRFSTSSTILLSYDSHHFQSLNLYELLIQDIKSFSSLVSIDYQVLSPSKFPNLRELCFIFFPILSNNFLLHPNTSNRGRVTPPSMPSFQPVFVSLLSLHPKSSQSVSISCCPVCA